jgi:hypothetical protein
LSQGHTPSVAKNEEGSGLRAVDNRYVSPLNRDVKPAAAGEFAALAIGELEIWPPVVLAPMAGITNYPFRTPCRDLRSGLRVNEMITARAVPEHDAKTLRLSHFSPDEEPRGLQLYGVDPQHSTRRRGRGPPGWARSGSTTST